MKRGSLIALGLVVFGVSLALNAPADRLHAWFAADDATLQPRGLSGTLSSGHAAQIDVQGLPAVRDIAWTLQTWRLLLGRASFKLSGGADGMLIDGRASLVPSGTLTLSDFRLASPLKILLSAAGQGLLPVEGTVGTEITSLKLRDQWPDSAEGLVTVRGLGWKLGREPVLLGDYEALLENETAGIKATIHTLGGPLEVKGESRVSHDRSYELDLAMRPKPDAPPMVPNLVRNLGQPDAQGWYHLRRRGATAGSTRAPPLQPAL